MSGFVYLLRNGDLYKIGQSNNLNDNLRKLNPDEIITTLKTDQPELLKARLLKRYKSKRLPDTGYFRLSCKEVEDCVRQLDGNSQMPHILEVELNICLNGSFLITLIAMILSLFLGFGFIFGLFIGIIFGSLPMWILFLSGSFGGYDLVDLPLFTTMVNRLKGLFIAISMNSIAYVMYKVFNISIWINS